MNPINILHISDLHLGSKRGSDSFVLDRLIEDINSQYSIQMLQSSIVVVTGDITNRGMASEFSQARSFFKSFIEALNLKRSHVVLVPGNHDMAWSFAIVNKERSLRHFKNFYSDFYNNERHFSSTSSNLHYFKDLNLVIAGFNSCRMEGISPLAFGIDIEQIRSTAEEINNLTGEEPPLCIAAMHHNLIDDKGSFYESSPSEQAVKYELAKAGFSLVLTGHQHFAAVQQTYIPGVKSLVVLSTGSSGFGHVLPQESNRYQSIQIQADAISVLSRVYSQEIASWVADNVVFPSGTIKLSLPDAPSPPIDVSIDENYRPEGPRIFISHSTKDNDFVRRLSSDLQRSGIRIWRDDIEIKVGDSIVSRINEGLVRSDYVLVVLSKNSIPSTWVQREMDAAFVIAASNASIKILPVRIDNTEAPPLISALRFADFRESYNVGVEELIEAIET